MLIGDRVMIENGVQVFEKFDFLSREEGCVDVSERYEADVEEREDLDVVGRRDGGGQKNRRDDCGHAEVALGQKFG